MIIESAFLKLPEMLISSFDKVTIETNVVNLMMKALQMELECRKVASDYYKIESEKPYPIRKRRQIRADLFVDLYNAADRRLEWYGQRGHNWLETKVFFGRRRADNTGRIIRDLLRLSVFQSVSKEVCAPPGRYMLLVFEGQPGKHLPVEGGEYAWIRQLTSAKGRRLCNVSILLNKLPEHVRRAVGPGFVKSCHLTISLSLRVTAFEPFSMPVEAKPVFRGFLLRIGDINQISYHGRDVTWKDDRLDGVWDEARVRSFSALREEVLKSMTLDDDDSDE